MGPIRQKSRTPRYDPELPENWTINRLKRELNNREIVFPVNARIMTLVRMLRRYTSASTDSSPPSANGRGHPQDNTSTRSHNTSHVIGNPKMINGTGQSESTTTHIFSNTSARSQDATDSGSSQRINNHNNSTYAP